MEKLFFFLFYLFYALVIFASSLSALSLEEEFRELREWHLRERTAQTFSRWTALPLGIKVKAPHCSPEDIHHYVEFLSITLTWRFGRIQHNEVTCVFWAPFPNQKLPDELHWRTPIFPKTWIDIDGFFSATTALTFLISVMHFRFIPRLF